MNEKKAKDAIAELQKTSKEFRTAIREHLEGDKELPPSEVAELRRQLSEMESEIARLKKSSGSGADDKGGETSEDDTDSGFTFFDKGAK